MTEAPRTFYSAVKLDDRTLLRETACAIWEAGWCTRVLRKTNVAALLPAVAEDLAEDLDPEDLWRRVDQLTRRALFWKRGKHCFYRSFAVASILRRRGVPAGIDFGLRLSGARRKHCHCWVTLRGGVLGEESDPLQAFPLALGQQDETVRYWLADDNTKG